MHIKDEVEKKDYSKDENLWASLLAEVLSNSQSQNLTSKSLLVLGDEESGKTTLISRTQSHSEPRAGCGLEYMYIDVKDEYSEEQTRLSVWIVDGNMHHRSLLRFALTEKTFESSAILLVAAMDKPWDIMDSLQRWAEVVTMHVKRLNIDSDVRNKREELIYKQFQDYVEPDEGSVPQARRVATQEENSELLVPLGDNILTVNLGIPIVVVLTKSDEIMRLEKDNEYTNQHWDFIQQHIRKFCLKYGAALFYTSGKENKNCSLLYRYLTHRLYGFPFIEKACIVEKDCIFIPSGYDNEKQLKILYEGLTNMRPDDNYADHIRAPISSRNPANREVEIIEEDEQTLQLKLQNNLLKPIDSSQTTRTPPKLNTQLSMPKSSRTIETVSSSPNLSTKKPLDPKATNANDSSVLSSFFNSLLNKKNMDEKSTVKLEAKSTDSAASPTTNTIEQVVPSSEFVDTNSAT